MRYVLEVAQKYPETENFYRWFIDQLEPQIIEQSWYQPWQSSGEQG